MMLARKAPSPLFRTVWPGVVATVIAAAVIALVNYLAWGIGVWGDYEVWRWVGLGVVLAALAAFYGWNERPWGAVIPGTLVTSMAFAITSIIAARSGLWIIGLIEVAGLTFGGMALVAYTISRRRRRLHGRSEM